MLFSLRKRDPIKATWLAAIADDLRRTTPDAAVLMRYELQLLFVYDQMMEGLYDAEKLGPESMFMATAYTAAEYTHWKKKLGVRSESICTFPKTNGRWSFDKPARVQGQIYAVRPEKILGLDKEKNNMVEFKRIRVRLVIPYRTVQWVKDRDAIAYLTGKAEANSIIITEEKVCEIKAWMYVGTEHWDELLDGGFLFAPVRRFIPKSTVTRIGIPEYSRFTQLEWEDK